MKTSFSALIKVTDKKRHRTKANASLESLEAETVPTPVVIAGSSDKKNEDILNITNESMLLRINKITKNHDVFLAEFLGHHNSFKDLILFINNMDEHDVLNMYINSYGGSIVTMGFICSAMLRCKGKIITILNGMACSAGSMIWSCGYKLLVLPLSHGMWHMAWGPSFGRLDVQSRNLSHRVAITLRFLSYCKNRGILTSEEFDRIVNKGEDIYLNYEELVQRSHLANLHEVNYKTLLPSKVDVKLQGKEV